MRNRRSHRRRRRRLPRLLSAPGARPGAFFPLVPPCAIFLHCPYAHYDEILSTEAPPFLAALLTLDLKGEAERRREVSRRPSMAAEHPRQSATSPFLALDMRGTLIKLVYTARCGGEAEVQFAKFERRRLDDCFNFIQTEELFGCSGSNNGIIFDKEQQWYERGMVDLKISLTWEPG